MRLTTLHLEKYGLFANQKMHFGPNAAGQPDLHIIYGDNEAGKTTALSAWLDFLFGIKRNTPYSFRHGPSMKIGASLADGASGILLYRSKGNKDTLRHADGSIGNEGSLSGLLGGFGRTQYELIYSVNDETLEKGGEEIVNSRGDLGKLLFSASAGIAEISKHLGELECECDAFYRLKARKTGLNDRKTELKALAEQKKGIEVTATEYATITKTLQAAATELDGARQRRDEKLKEFHDVGNRLRALSTINQLTANRKRQQEIGLLPAPPQGWRKLWQETKDTHREAKITGKRLQDEAIALEAELESLVVNENALVPTDDLERVEAARVAYAGAVKDLPKRQSERDHLTQDIQHQCALLSATEDDIEILLPDNGIVSELQSLIKKHGRIEEAVETSQNELEQANERCVETRDRLGSRSQDPEHITRLEALLECLEQHNPRQDQQTTAAQRREINARIDTSLKELAPWSGTIDVLAQLTPPSVSRISTWQQSLTHCQSRIDETAERISAAAAECALIDAELTSHRSEGTVSYKELAALRTRREHAWSAHRDALDVETANIFESTLREHDELITRYVNDRNREEGLRQKQHQRTELKASIKSLKKRKGTHLKARKKIERDIVKALGSALPDCTAADMLDMGRDWLAARKETLDRWHEAQRLEIKESDLTNEIAALASDFATALRAAELLGDEAMPLDGMIALARRTVREMARNAEIREQLNQAERDRQRRTRNAGKAKQRAEDWHAEWRRACESVVFGADHPGVEIMTQRLEVIGKIKSLVERQRMLERRIQGMEHDVEQFVTEIQAMTNRLTVGTGNTAENPDLLENSDPLGAWREISNTIRRAQDHTRDRERIKARLAENRDAVREVAARIEQTGKVIAELGEPYNLTDMQVLEQTLERADALQQLIGAEKDLIDSLGDILPSDNVDAAEAELQGAVRPELEARKSALEQECKTLEILCNEKMMEHDRCQRELDSIGGDDDVARLDLQIANLELSLEDAAVNHLRQRLGIFAVESTIRTYMQTHRSDMMKKASEVFRLITGDAYTGLTTVFQGTSEVLMAEAADGVAKLADGLSKGTRFQLYLALRIAGIHETLKASPPLPFIADDIIETFDDRRAARTLTALEDLARATQVICFTHHRHLCDIARETCSNVTIQEIGAP
ncbi:MAG: AAA family ATPase [Rhodobacteraceae bacterium]|nr:AAA family ATPase [Paracoccaceae bacterium]